LPRASSDRRRAGRAFRARGSGAASSAWNELRDAVKEATRNASFSYGEIDALDPWGGLTTVEDVPRGLAILGSVGIERVGFDGLAAARVSPVHVGAERREDVPTSTDVRRP
jgi:hypothetical protein